MLCLTLTILVTIRASVIRTDQTPKLSSRELLEVWNSKHPGSGKNQRSLSKNMGQNVVAGQQKVTVTKQGGQNQVQVNTKLPNGQNGIATFDVSNLPVGTDVDFITTTMSDGKVIVQTEVRQRNLPITGYQKKSFSTNMVPVFQNKGKFPGSFDKTLLTQFQTKSKSETLVFRKDITLGGLIEPQSKFSLEIESRMSQVRAQSKSQFLTQLKGAISSKILMAIDQKEITDDMQKNPLKQMADKQGFEVVSNDAVVNINANLEVLVDQESSLDGGVFPMDLKFEADLTSVCNSEIIGMVISQKGGAKDLMSLTQSNSNLKKMPGNWMDHYIAIVYMKNGQNSRSNAGKELFASISQLSIALQKFIDYFNLAMSTRIHVYGTTWFSYRTTFIINYYRKMMGWKPNTLPTVPQGYELFFRSIIPISVEKNDYELLAKMLNVQDDIQTSDITVQKYEFLGKSISVWSPFPKMIADLKLMLCLNVLDVVYLYAGKTEYLTLAKKLATSFDKDLSSQNIGKMVEHSQQIFTQFGNLLETPMRPQGCGVNEAKTLRDLIQYAKIGKVISYMTVFVSETSFFSENFFSYLLQIGSSQFSTIIELDLLLLRRTYDTTTFFKLLKYVDYQIIFNPDFFQDLHTVTFKEWTMVGNKKELQVIKITNIDFFSTFFTLNSASRMELENNNDITIYYTNVLIYIYKFYVMLRAQNVITSTTTVIDIYKAMFKLVTEMKGWGYNSDFWGGFMVKGHFAQHYFTVITFICDKIGGDFCQKAGEKEFEQQYEDIIPTPDIDPIPKPFKDKIYIIEFIITIITRLKIKKELDEFFIWWNSQAWGLPNCGRVKRQEAFSRPEFTVQTTGDKNSKKEVRTEKMTEYILYSDACSSQLFTVIHEKITTFLTTWKGDFSEFWKIFILLINGPKDAQREAVRYIIIRIVRYYIKNPNPAPSTNFMLLIFKLISVFETELMDSLNYMRTAGFYGYFDMLTNDYQITQENLNMYFNTKRFDLKMLMFDSYYLTYVAYQKTNQDQIPTEKQKLWKANTAYMLMSYTKQWNRFALPGKSPEYSFEEFRANILMCRSQMVFTGPENKPVLASAEECSETADPDGRKVSGCWSVVNNYSQCDKKFAFEFLNWLLTARVMIKSVSVFNHYNYFHHYYLPGTDGLQEANLHGIFVQDIRDKKMYEAIYKHLQLVRDRIEGQFDDVRNYVINKVVHCANMGNVPVKTADFGQSYCVFNPSLYGSIFWVLKHAYLVNFPATTFNLDGFNPLNPPMGTFNYMILLINNPRMNQDFEALCNEEPEPTKRAPVCKIKYLIEFWISQMSESQKSGNGLDGVEQFEGIFGLKASGRGAAIQGAINSKGSQEFSVEKFYLLEAYYSMYQIVQRNLSQFVRLKSVMNYYDTLKTDGGKDELMDFYATQKAFEFSKPILPEEINIMAAFLRFTFRDTTINQDELSVRSAIIALLDGTQISAKSMDSNKLTLFEQISTYHTSKQIACLKFFVLFANEEEHYVKISTLLALRNQFLDVISIEIKQDVLSRLIVTMQDSSCKSSPMGCLVEFINTNSFDLFTMTTFEMDRMDGTLGMEGINLDLPDDTFSSQYDINSFKEMKYTDIQFETTKVETTQITQIEAFQVQSNTEVQSFALQENTNLGGQMQNEVRQVVQEEEEFQGIKVVKKGKRGGRNAGVSLQQVSSKVKDEDTTQDTGDFSNEDPSIQGVSVQVGMGGTIQSDASNQAKNDLAFFSLNANLDKPNFSTFDSNQSIEIQRSTSVSLVEKKSQMGWTSNGSKKFDSKTSKSSKLAGNSKFNDMNLSLLRS